MKCGELVEDGESQWRNLERKFGFRKIGEDGVSSFASRMTQGIFVGHHLIEQEQLCALPKIVVERATEVEPRRLYVLSTDIEVHGHIGG